MMLKKFVPKKLRRSLKRLLLSIGWTPPMRPYAQSESAARAGRAAYAEIEWPDATEPRFIYSLTPPANLSNIGDHAQVVAIRRWIAKHYPGNKIVELDKDAVIACIEDLRKKIVEQDIIVLHSGGNMGDRGRWSETARRLMISSFHKNQVISLPQTIYFSDTKFGQREKAISEEVYNEHPNLTVLGRDRVSGEIAKRMFPNAAVATAPDFVLSLQEDSITNAVTQSKSSGVLACLRLDDESVLKKDHHRIVNMIGDEVKLFDTTFERPIAPERREVELNYTLRVFAKHRSIITDRYHGLIFAVLCRKPVVVLRTVDHKLTSALEWFSEIPNVLYCKNIDELPRLLREVEAIGAVEYPDFNELYFDKIRDLIVSASKGTF